MQHSNTKPVIEGMVLFVHTDLVDPSKHKYLIVSYISPRKIDVGLVIVGTHPSPFGAKNPAIGDRQLLIPKDQRNLFTLYSSYANCADIKLRPFSEVQGWIDDNPSVIRGYLTGRELYKIKGHVSTAPTINQALKDRLGINP